MAKKNQGFTLVELLVTIVVGALVTLAATTVILMGLRLNRQSMNTATRHNTARVLLTALEDMASEGAISGFRMDYEDWEIYGEEILPQVGEEKNYQVLYSYDAENHVISTNGAPIMEDVLSSYLEYEDGLLTISVETEEGIFNSTVYCRMAISPSGTSGVDNEKIPDVEVDNAPTIDEDSIDVEDKAARVRFVQILLSQYFCGNNYGRILNSDEVLGDYKDKNDEDMYYSQWYIGDGWLTNGWNKDTPWCACFISWGVAEAYNQNITTYTDNSDNYRPAFAGVDSFLAHFYAKGKWIYQKEQLATMDNSDATTGKPIYPGDVIFLDWVVNDERNPQHVGVVLYYDDTYVYTIEGNVSDGDGGSVVGLRKYKLDDPRILGYGVLDWKTDEELTTQDSK